jgi:hypothetical protein
MSEVKKRRTRGKRAGARVKAKAKVVDRPTRVEPTKATAMADSRVRQLVEQAEDASHKRIDCTTHGRDWMDVLLNPFREGLGADAIKKVDCGTPDSSGSDSVLLACVETLTFSGATATNGFIAPGPPTAGDGSLIVFYGNSASTPANSPTAFSSASQSPEGTMLDAIVGSNKYRLLSIGLKVNLGSGDDTKAGVLKGGTWDGNLFGTAPTTWTTYAEAISSIEGATFDVSDGITVRSKYWKANRDFVTPPANQYGATAGELFRTLGSRPLVQFTGLAATTLLSIKAVWYIEVKVAKNNCPIPLKTPPHEPEFEGMVYFVNNQPYIVAGHSFKSFLKGAAKAAGGAFRWVTKNTENVGKVAAALL